jgi:hypothetical protein
VAEKIRFYLDQHIPSAVAQGLRRRGVDILTTQEADRCGYSDLDQLVFEVLAPDDFHNHIEFL